MLSNSINYLYTLGKLNELYLILTAHGIEYMPKYGPFLIDIHRTKLFKIIKYRLFFIYFTKLS